MASLPVALVGNPNTGKSTLFNALSGLNQRVGNYPGCTVEEKVGEMSWKGRSLTLIDLPGTYSLAPRSLDEMVTVDVLLGRRRETPRPKAVICIVDASNLERNLYLLSQVLELGLPVVVALNMTDVAADLGLEIDVDLLRKRLALPIVEVQANVGRGIDELRDELLLAAEKQPSLPAGPKFPEPFEREADQLGERMKEYAQAPIERFLVQRLLLDTSGYLPAANLPGVSPAIAADLPKAQARLAELGCPVPAVEAMARYGWIGKVLAEVVRRPKERPRTWTDRIDEVLTHPIWGTAVFVLLMVAVFQAIFNGAAPLMEWIDQGIGAFAGFVADRMPEGDLRSLVVTGVIGGVGGVLVFLPQICILFLFIAILEDCGYMARAAFLMDKLMSQIGLSGKSFIPLLSSFACAIPGVMATRVIENSRDRLVTILIAPLMSCSARLPVYTLLIAAFIPDIRWAGGWIGLQGLVMVAMYAVGIFTSIAVAWILKMTVLPGETPPFVLELPLYKIPAAGNVVYRVGERAWSFLYRAGTLILAISIVVWALSYYPRDAAIEASFDGERQALAADRALFEVEDETGLGADVAIAWESSLDDREEEIQRQIASQEMEGSYLGQMGKWIEPAVRPLGWDWRIGCAAIASFPAREVVVGTLGVIYRQGDEIDPESNSLHDALRESRWSDTGLPVFNIPVALSIMVFFALCAQCAATLAAIYRETNSFFWPTFTFVYMTVLAWLAAFVTYQAGMWIMGAMA